MTLPASERTLEARELFAPLGPTYDRAATLLSFGQDPRWRRFLVTRIGARPGDLVCDVATGTGAVALELARRYGCRVVGFDQSPEMLAAGRERVARSGLAGRIDLRLGRAEELPLADAGADHLTCTYLLRYVDDPAATLAELARVVRPGGRVGYLEFQVPPRPWRPLWDVYVDAVLPVLGRLVAPPWVDVGHFLGPSIREFCARLPLPDLVRLFQEAGIPDAQAQTLSLGGAAVIWGTRGG